MNSNLWCNLSGRSNRGLAAFVIVLAAALFASGCSGDGEKTNLENQLGLGLEGTLAREVKVEAFLRQCMKTQGFEYVAVDPVARLTGLAGKSGLDEEEFEKQFGYGVTTLYEQRRNLAADPNTAIRNKLSAAEQAAYNRALYGANADATFAVAVDTGDYSRLGGCTKSATETVFGGPQVLQSLAAKLDELDQRILADPRMQKAVVKWANCMRVAGYDGLDEPERIDALLKKRLDAIVGPASNPKPDYDRAALAALQKDEVTMVAADKACEKKELEKVDATVRGEYEKAFREQNADLLSKISKP